MAKLPAYGVALLTGILSSTATAAIQIVPGAGFSGVGADTPVDPVGGNSGTTLGQQRLQVFETAADMWEERLQIDFDIEVAAQFTDLFCDDLRATLGSAGPTTVSRDFPEAPFPSTWYVGAYYYNVAAAAQDETPGALIATNFNALLDGGDCLGGATWYYGIDGQTPGGQLNFLDVLMHELGHGLGFTSLVGEDGGLFIDFIDAYSRNLYDQVAGTGWADMSDAERASSILSDGDLVWSGPQVSALTEPVNLGLNDGKVQMYAPNPYQAGSSVSHFDTDVDLIGVAGTNELMEPFINSSMDDFLAVGVMGDIGWDVIYDYDGDGLSIPDEIAQGSDPLDANPDGDALNDAEELAAGTDPFEPDSDTDGVWDGYDSDPLSDAYKGRELASTTVGHNWKSIALPSLFTDPVVIVGPPTYKGADPGVVRVRNVSGDEFEAKFTVSFQEWDYLNGSHNQEAIDHVVLEKGVHTMADGSVWQVGTFDLAGNRAWSSVSFAQAFTGMPHLFLTPQTSNGASAVAARARLVTSTGFDAALFEQESLTDGHGTETVGYLAIWSDAGSGGTNVTMDGLQPYILQSAEVGTSFHPVLNQSIKLEEETSKDVETNHLAETVDVLGLGGAIFAQDVSYRGGDTIALRRRAPINSSNMEWGLINSATDALTTVPLKHTYTDPVVVVKAARKPNTEFGIARVANIQADHFQVRFQEWDYLTGGHPAEEQIFYMVAEAGTFDLFGLQVNAGNSSLGDVGQVIDISAAGFTEVPAIFASASSENEVDAVTTRIDNVSASSFTLMLQEQEANVDGHIDETVSWIAVEKGLAASFTHKLEVGSMSAGHAPVLYSFNQPIDRAFAFVVPQLSSLLGADPGHAMQSNVSSTGVEVFVQEERSENYELGHLHENIDLFIAE